MLTVGTHTPQRGMPMPRARTWAVERMKATDLGPLMGTVGVLVDELYPRGAAKLQERLEDALNGYALAHVVRARRSGKPIALASEVQKGASGTKLSTFWVHPVMRGRGAGKALLSSRIEGWQRAAAPLVTVTVREERSPELERLFVPCGFNRVDLVRDLYGEEKSEVILQWVLDTSQDAVRSLAA